MVATIAIFEAAWFACVIAAAHEAMVWGIAAVAGSILWQLSISRHRSVDLTLMAAAFAVGLVWDTALTQLHLVVYASHAPFTGIAPLWILALWAQLGSVLREPLRWLHGRPWLTAGLGAVGGAASYAGAARMGACAFPDAQLALLVLAVGWALALPALSQLARRLDARDYSLRSRSKNGS